MKRCMAILAAAALVFGACTKKDEGQEGKKPAAGNEKASGDGKQELIKLGKSLAGADLVTVAALLKDPKTYEGKIVRVEGKIEDFCHHKRAWFGVNAAEGKGMVRVFTLPRFEVPMNCKGKQAVAEGKVEVIKLNPEELSHFSKEHKFLAGVTVEEGKPVLRPVIRAFGAELR